MLLGCFVCLFGGTFLFVLMVLEGFCCCFGLDFAVLFVFRFFFFFSQLNKSCKENTLNGEDASIGLAYRQATGYAGRFLD